MMASESQSKQTLSLSLSFDTNLFQFSVGVR